MQLAVLQLLRTLLLAYVHKLGALTTPGTTRTLTLV